MSPGTWAGPGRSAGTRCLPEAGAVRAVPARPRTCSPRRIPAAFGPRWHRGGGPGLCGRRGVVGEKGGRKERECWCRQENPPCSRTPRRKGTGKDQLVREGNGETG